MLEKWALAGYVPLSWEGERVAVYEDERLVGLGCLVEASPLRLGKEYWLDRGIPRSSEPTRVQLLSRCFFEGYPPEEQLIVKWRKELRHVKPTDMISESFPPEPKPVRKVTLARWPSGAETFTYGTLAVGDWPVVRWFLSEEEAEGARCLALQYAEAGALNTLWEGARRRRRSRLQDLRDSVRAAKMGATPAQVQAWEDEISALLGD